MESTLGNLDLASEQMGEPSFGILLVIFVDLKRGSEVEPNLNRELLVFGSLSSSSSYLEHAGSRRPESLLSSFLDLTGKTRI